MVRTRSNGRSRGSRAHALPGGGRAFPLFELERRRGRVIAAGSPQEKKGYHFFAIQEARVEQMLQLEDTHNFVL